MKGEPTGLPDGLDVWCESHIKNKDVSLGTQRDGLSTEHCVGRRDVWDGGESDQFGTIEIDRSIRYPLIAYKWYGKFYYCTERSAAPLYRRIIHPYLIALKVSGVICFAFPKQNQEPLGDTHLFSSLCRDW